MKKDEKETLGDYVDRGFEEIFAEQNGKPLCPDHPNVVYRTLTVEVGITPLGKFNLFLAGLALGLWIAKLRGKI